MLLYVFDLDGTLCDDTHRAHHIARTNPDGTERKVDNSNWDTYHLACVDDEVIEEMASVVKILRAIPAVQVWYLSGRTDIALEQTKQWLADRDLFWEDRKIPAPTPKITLKRNDKQRYTPSPTFKVAKIRKYLAANPDTEFVAIFDDRTDVLDAVGEAYPDVYRVLMSDNGPTRYTAPW